MQLADLKTGMIVVTRNHNVYYILRDFMNGSSIHNILWNDGDWLFFSRYNDDLTCRVDYHDISMMWNNNPTPSEVQNSRRRARRFAKAHDIMEIHIPALPTDFFSFDPDATKVLWKRGEEETESGNGEDLDIATSCDKSQDPAEENDLRGIKTFQFPEILRMETPTLSDLRTGLLVTLRNGLLCLVLRDFYDSDFNSSDVLWSPNGCIPLSSYSADMNYTAASLPFEVSLFSEDAATPASPTDSLIQDNAESGHPYDIADVYLSDYIGDIYKKEPNHGIILWRNEPMSITIRRWIMDVPHCRYSGKTELLGPEGIKPPWISDKNWADIVARGLVLESREESHI